MVEDPHNGYVKAYVGGPDFRYFKYDAVTTAEETGRKYNKAISLYSCNAKRIFSLLGGGGYSTDLLISG